MLSAWDGSHGVCNYSNQNGTLHETGQVCILIVKKRICCVLQIEVKKAAPNHSRGGSAPRGGGGGGQGTYKW